MKTKTIIQAISYDSQGMIRHYLELSSITMHDLDELQDYVRAKISQPEVTDVVIRKREYKL